MFSELLSLKWTIDQKRQIITKKLLDDISEQISRHVKFNSARSTLVQIFDEVHGITKVKSYKFAF